MIYYCLFNHQQTLHRRRCFLIVLKHRMTLILRHFFGALPSSCPCATTSWSQLPWIMKDRWGTKVRWLTFPPRWVWHIRKPYCSNEQETVGENGSGGGGLGVLTGERDGSIGVYWYPHNYPLGVGWDYVTIYICDCLQNIKIVDVFMYHQSSQQPQLCGAVHLQQIQ